MPYLCSDKTADKASTFSMQILLVAATELETNWIRNHLKLEEEDGLWVGTMHHHSLHLLHTGVGMVNTAFYLGLYLATHQPDLAINFGIAGSFDRNIPLGSVVEVGKDAFSELGAESPEGFLDMKALGFPVLATADNTYFNELPNPAPALTTPRRVEGITVNLVHGISDSIQKARNLWDKDIETMEGAAFFHAMLAREVPFYAFRGISNYVEIRDKGRWNITLAIKNVQKSVIDYILHSLNS